MDRHDESTYGDESGIQADGRVTQKPAEPPLPNAPIPPARESPRPLLHRIWTALIPWLSIPSMCLGFGSVYFQVLVFKEYRESAAPSSITRIVQRETVCFTLFMAAGAVASGLLGCWLSRREVTRIEKELVYPRGRPVTIQSRLWAFIGLICGTLGLVTGAIFLTLI